jgi:hypothetical protein
MAPSGTGPDHSDLREEEAEKERPEGGLPSEESEAIGKKPTPLNSASKSLDNKMTELLGRLNYQWDIKNCNILCFTVSWLNDDNTNIQLSGYMMSRQYRTAPSGKTKGGGLCIFVNNSCCTTSKEVSSYSPPEVEFLMISCRPHYLSREFSSIFFVALHTTTVRGWH